MFLLHEPHSKPVAFLVLGAFILILWKMKSKVNEKKIQTAYLIMTSTTLKRVENG